MSVSFDIELIGGTPNLDRMIALCEDREGMNQVVGMAAQLFIQQHLRAYNASHANKLGGPRQNTYSAMANATSNVPDQEGATVLIAHIAARLQYFGGTVYPGRNPSYVSGKPTQRLTIPAIPGAYGTRAGEWTDLHVVHDPDSGRLALADVNLSSARRGKNVLLAEMNRLRKMKLLSPADRLAVKMKMRGVPIKRDAVSIIFWLVKKAVIPEHTDMLPTGEQILEAVKARLWSWLGRHVKP